LKQPHGENLLLKKLEQCSPYHAMLTLGWQNGKAKNWQNPQQHF